MKPTGALPESREHNDFNFYILFNNIFIFLGDVMELTTFKIAKEKKINFQKKIYKYRISLSEFIRFCMEDSDIWKLAKKKLLK
jgi:hypothetical protein